MATCSCPSSSTTLLSSARCLIPNRQNCVYNATFAAAVEPIGLHCLQADGGLRGFYLRARARDRSEICTGGDVLRAWVLETKHERSRFSTYAAPVDEHSWPSLYFVNTTSATPLAGPRVYSVSVALIETQKRDLQHAEGRGILQWSVQAASPVRDWFRYRECLTRYVPLPASLPMLSADARNATTLAITIKGGNAAEKEEPRCHIIPPDTPTALIALDSYPRHACNQWCSGNATSVLTPFRGPKDIDRSKVGYRHVLKPDGCKYHFYDEPEVARCFRGRSVLNMGGSVAMSVQRGMERIRGPPPESRAEWWWRFGRTGITGDGDRALGRSYFGKFKHNRSVVQTQFIHHPFRYGLTNIVSPDPKKVVALKSAKAWESFMCSFDIVILESGVHDLASPDRRAHQQMRNTCGGATPCTDAMLMPSVHNETWRLDLLASYKTHLEQLMGMWKRCKAERLSRKKPVPFRPIFKLATAPNPITEMRSCTADWGYNTQGWYLDVGNKVARKIVEGSGFEVFDTFPAFLHANGGWFDNGGRDALHSDVLSDLVTQMILGHICGKEEGEEEQAA